MRGRGPRRGPSRPGAAPRSSLRTRNPLVLGSNNGPCRTAAEIMSSVLLSVLPGLVKCAGAVLPPVAVTVTCDVICCFYPLLVPPSSSSAGKWGDGRRKNRGSVAEWSKALVLGTSLIEAWVRIPPLSIILFSYFLIHSHFYPIEPHPDDSPSRRLQR